MKKYKVGVVGLGKITHLHAQALREISNAEFTAGFSRSIAKAESYLSEYGAKPYDNITRMVKEEGLDNDLLARLAVDTGVPFTQAELEELIGDYKEFTGRAAKQTEEFLEEVVQPRLQAFQELIGDVDATLSV